MSVFHLKYRPQNFAQLDLEGVAERLKEILSEMGDGGSFLFAGPKGAGKTSAARIISRAVNCLEPVGVEPCDKCNNCTEILAGRSLDIVEIDAASNRGIDDIRSLKDKAFLLPSKLKKKMFIIDEAHMLTKEAFNALLKLLEEPPRHVLFILCTTDPAKIPETVLSRLIRIDFRGGNRKELRTSLKRIIEGEEIVMSEEAIEAIVNKSDGSFRNLQKMFNEIYLQFGKKIDLEQVGAYFKQKLGDYAGGDLEADLLAGRIKEIIKRFEGMAKTGVDFRKYREEMLRFFHQRLVESLTGGVTGGMDRLRLEGWLELLVEAGAREKETEVSQLPLELAVIKFINNKQITNLKLQSTNEMGEEERIEMSEPEKRWPEVLAAVKPDNHSVEAFLRATRPKKLIGDKLILEVYYPFHKDRLEEPKNREIVERGLRQIFGREIKLECQLSKGKKVIKETSGGGDIYDVAKEIFG